MSEYIDYLRELFQEFGAIDARRMFGGYGIYRGDIMFGLVADNTLYLKVDQMTEPHYRQRGLPAFTYTRKGKTIALSYYLAPEEALEDPSELRQWAEQAYGAAVRAAK